MEKALMYLSMMLNTGSVHYIPNSHREGIDVLVKLIQETDTLNDHVVHSVDIKLDLVSRITVAKTQLCLPSC